MATLPTMSLIGSHVAHRPLPAAPRTRHTLHTGHSTPLPHQQCTLTAASLVARQPPAAARQLEPLLGPLGNVATCNWQLPPPFADDGRRATGDGRQATGDGLFSLPLWHWQLTARAACNLFDLPLLAKQPQFCNSLAPQLCLSLSLPLAPLASFSVAPFTVSPQMSVAQKKERKFGYLMQILCAGQIVQLLFAILPLFRTLASRFVLRFGTVYA